MEVSQVPQVYLQCFVKVIDCVLTFSCSHVVFDRVLPLLALPWTVALRRVQREERGYTAGTTDGRGGPGLTQPQLQPMNVDGPGSTRPQQ